MSWIELALLWSMFLLRCVVRCGFILKNAPQNPVIRYAFFHTRPKKIEFLHQVVSFKYATMSVEKLSRLYKNELSSATFLNQIFIAGYAFVCLTDSVI
jgi:hypothetical protein